MKLSATKIKDFKGCRKLYYLKYVEGVIPKIDTEALETGKSYHSKIEEIYNNGYFTPSGDKTDAMAMAYEKYIYPKFKVKCAENWFDYRLNDKHSLVGRFDAIAENGWLVEHKTTSSDLNEYQFDLQWSEQILCYMLAYGTNSMYYTLIRKPTIRQKQNESEEDFIQRCCDWYDVDTDNKIAVVIITRTAKEIEDFKAELIDLANDMEECESKHKFYCNSNHCSKYGARCPYSSICLNYDPNIEYCDFIKKGEK